MYVRLCLIGTIILGLVLAGGCGARQSADQPGSVDTGKSGTSAPDPGAPMPVPAGKQAAIGSLLYECLPELWLVPAEADVNEGRNYGISNDGLSEEVCILNFNVPHSPPDMLASYRALFASTGYSVQSQYLSPSDESAVEVWELLAVRDDVKLQVSAIVADSGSGSVGYIKWTNEAPGAGPAKIAAMMTAPRATSLTPAAAWQPSCFPFPRLLPEPDDLANVVELSGRNCDFNVTVRAGLEDVHAFFVRGVPQEELDVTRHFIEWQDETLTYALMSATGPNSEFVVVLTPADADPGAVNVQLKWETD